jgi:hypothetical protein
LSGSGALMCFLHVLGDVLVVLFLLLVGEARPWRAERAGICCRVILSSRSHPCLIPAVTY